MGWFDKLTTNGQDHRFPIYLSLSKDRPLGAPPLSYPLRLGPLNDLHADVVRGFDEGDH